MAIQDSGIISLSDLQTEFDGENPIALSEYYRGGAYVPNSNAAVPAAGEVSFSDFYGAVNQSFTSQLFTSSGTYTPTSGATSALFLVFSPYKAVPFQQAIVGGGGGGFAEKFVATLSGTYSVSGIDSGSSVASVSGSGISVSAYANAGGSSNAAGYAVGGDLNASGGAGGIGNRFDTGDGGYGGAGGSRCGNGNAGWSSGTTYDGSVMGRVGNGGVEVAGAYDLSAHNIIFSYRGASANGESGVPVVNNPSQTAWHTQLNNHLDACYNTASPVGVNSGSWGWYDNSDRRGGVVVIEFL